MQRTKVFETILLSKSKIQWLAICAVDQFSSECQQGSGEKIHFFITK